MKFEEREKFAVRRTQSTLSENLGPVTKKFAQIMRTPELESNERGDGVPLAQLHDSNALRLAT